MDDDDKTSKIRTIRISVVTGCAGTTNILCTNADIFREIAELFVSHLPYLREYIIIGPEPDETFCIDIGVKVYNGDEAKCSSPMYFILMMHGEYFYIEINDNIIINLVRRNIFCELMFTLYQYGGKHPLVRTVYRRFEQGCLRYYCEKNNQLSTNTQTPIMKLYERCLAEF